MGLMGSFSYASVSPNGNYAFPMSYLICTQRPITQGSFVKIADILKAIEISESLVCIGVSIFVVDKKK